MKPSKYWIIGRETAPDFDHDEDEWDEVEEVSDPRGRQRRGPRKALSKVNSSQYAYTSYTAAETAALARARKDECNYVIYEAVRLVELQERPVNVEVIE